MDHTVIGIGRGPGRATLQEHAHNTCACMSVRGSKFVCVGMETWQQAGQKTGKAFPDTAMFLHTLNSPSPNGQVMSGSSVGTQNKLHGSSGSEIMGALAFLSSLYSQIIMPVTS